MLTEVIKPKNERKKNIPSSFYQYDTPATANLLDMDLDSLQAATTPAAQVCQN